MAETIKKIGMGWLRDYPDFRDYTVEQETVPVKFQKLGQTEPVKAMLKKAGAVERARAPSLPASVDLRAWCSPIEDQLSLNSVQHMEPLDWLSILRENHLENKSMHLGCSCTRSQEICSNLPATLAHM